MQRVAHKGAIGQGVAGIGEHLNGKTIIPFTTHEGSGLGSCVKDVKKAYPNATVTGEFSMYGHDVRSGKERVEKWLKKIGF